MLQFHRLLRFLLVIVVLLGAAAIADACPTCKEGMAQSDPYHDQMVQGYFWSILFMMSMPFLIFGSWVTFIFFAIRKARREQAVTAVPGIAPTTA